MSSSPISENQDPLEADKREKLMACGLVYLEWGGGAVVAVARGTPMLTEEGWEVGKLAAVVLDHQGRQVTYPVLGLYYAPRWTIGWHRWKSSLQQADGNPIERMLYVTFTIFTNCLHVFCKFERYNRSRRLIMNLLELIRDGGVGMRARGGLGGEFGRRSVFRGRRPLMRPAKRPLFRPWFPWAGLGCLLYPLIGLGGFLGLVILMGLVR